MVSINRVPSYIKKFGNSGRLVKIALLLLGISALIVPVTAAPMEGTWRASQMNGDKPGIGIELRRNGTELSGNVFIIAPERPHDFRSGPSFPLRIDKDTGKEIVFTVRYDTDNIQTDRLIFDVPENRTKIRATLEPVPANGNKQEYIFRRIK